MNLLGFCFADINNWLIKSQFFSIPPYWFGYGICSVLIEHNSFHVCIIVGRQQFVEAEPQQARQPAYALGAQAPGEAERPAFRHVRDALAEDRRAAVGAFGVAERHSVGVKGQGGVQTCGNGEILGLCLSHRG